MPEWRKYKLGDLIKVNEETVDKNAEWINYIDISSVNAGFFDAPRKIKLSEAPSRAKRLLKAGDTVISSVRPYLKAYFHFKAPNPYTVASTGFAVLSPKKIDSRFLYYITTNDNYIQFLTNNCTGSAYPAFNIEVIEKSTVYIPDNVAEQHRIAKILGALDDKIELNLEMNKTLEEMAMAIYKEWFVDFGPFRDGEFIDSELGPIPKGLKIGSVYEVAKYINGTAFKQKDFEKFGLPIIKIAELKNGIGSNTKFTTKIPDSKFIIQNGEILFSWSATLDIFLWDKGKALLNQHIFKVVPNGKADLEFLFFMLKNVIKDFQSIAADRATTMGHIKKEHLINKLIVYPGPETRNKTSKLLLPIFELINRNMIQIWTLKKTRDYLLPKLISGEVRVKAAEEKMKEVL